MLINDHGALVSCSVNKRSSKFLKTQKCMVLCMFVLAKELLCCLRMVTGQLSDRPLDATVDVSTFEGLFMYM